MDIFNRKKVRELEDQLFKIQDKIEPIEKLSKKERQSIFNKIEKDSNYRVKQTIQKWRDALNYIEGSLNITDPLYQIIRELELDAHIQSTILLRKSRVTQLPFNILYKNDKKEDSNLIEINQIFNNQWFNQFIGYALDYVYEGYVAIEIETINSDKTLTVNKLPFNYLRPKYGKFVVNKNESYEKGIDLINNDYVIEVYDHRNDLGIYSKIAPLFMWSKNCHVAWSQYTERFGMPIIQYSTPKENGEEKRRINEVLKNIGTAMSMVTDIEDTLTFHQVQSTDAFKVYQEFINTCNSEINKLILGGTMVNEDGSSYSQSQTHQNQFNSLIKQDIRSIENLINSVLFPKMVKIGLLPNDLIFKFDTSQSLDIFQKFEIDKALIPYYDLDIEYINKTYNTAVTGIKNTFI